MDKKTGKNSEQNRFEMKPVDTHLLLDSADVKQLIDEVTFHCERKRGDKSDLHVKGADDSDND